MTALTSLVLTLEAKQPLSLPPFLGRASHGALLRFVAEEDRGLAERLHAPDERRPFTCSTLWGGRRRGQSLVLEPGESAFLRYTGLSEEMSRQLERMAERPPHHIEIEGNPLAVRQATLDPADHPWAGRTSYEELASRRLLPGGPLASRVELEFASPTAFRSGGRTLPVPLPDLVFSSLVEKWNSFAPVTVSEEVRRFAAECLAISRYRLSTQAVAGKGESVQIGFVGRCRYAVLNRDRYWLSLIHLLADYAFYAGVGYQTTVGMGQARRCGEEGGQSPVEG